MEGRAWREMLNENKKRLIGAGLIVGVIILCISAWFASAGRNDVSDIGKRADETRSELESAREEQRDQAAALDRAENAADRSQSAIRDSAERADRVQSLERSDAEIITESQSIIDRVRARGKKEN